MKDLLQVLLNGLTAIGIVVVGILILTFMVAPPKLVFLSVNNTDNATVDYDGMPLLPGFSGARFLYLGESDVYVTAAGYETAEIQFDQTANVFQGDVDVSSLLGFIFLVDVRLVAKDPNLKMIPYSGVLTAGGEGSPQILAIHPKYRGTHMPMDSLKRQYENQTGKPFSTLNYIQLLVDQDDSGEIAQVWLDFSEAKGGIVEYVPPAGWPAGNLLMRILHSMNAAPNGQYPQQLSLDRAQADTPYETGSTFFYCMINGYYCAGRVTTFYNSRGYQQAALELWHNHIPGDPRLRYR